MGKSVLKSCTSGWSDFKQRMSLSKSKTKPKQASAAMPLLPVLATQTHRRGFAGKTPNWQQGEAGQANLK